LTGTKNNVNVLFVFKSGSGSYGTDHHMSTS